jgi:hypothetical protein
MMKMGKQWKNKNTVTKNLVIPKMLTERDENLATLFRGKQKQTMQSTSKYTMKFREDTGTLN